MSIATSACQARPRPPRRCTRWIDATRAALGRVWRTLARTRRRVPVAVLVTNPVERRRLERELRREAARLAGLLGPFPDDTVVLVQQVIGGDRPLAGCYQVALGPDGTRCTRIQLALQVGTRRLSPEEVLGVLAEAALALANELSGAARARVPLTLPADAGDTARPTVEPRRAVPPDPLLPFAAREPVPANGRDVTALGRVA